MYAQMPPSPPALVAPAPAPLAVRSYIQFSKEGPNSKLVTAGQSARVTVYALEAGQEIPPHAGPAEAYMFVYEGKGLFTVGNQKVEVGAGQLVASGRNQTHGFKALDRLVVLAFAAPNPAATKHDEGHDGQHDEEDRDK